MQYYAAGPRWSILVQIGRRRSQEIDQTGIQDESLRYVEGEQLVQGLLCEVPR
jgi:hypothetical protein